MAHRLGGFDDYYQNPMIIIKMIIPNESENIYECGRSWRAANEAPTMIMGASPLSLSLPLTAYPLSFYSKEGKLIIIVVINANNLWGFLTVPLLRQWLS